jgi:hypothetical protein
MNESLKDILSNLNPDIDQETLLLYLQGKLSADQQHEIEKQMMDNDFESDALEGLEGFSDKKKLSGLLEQLNYDLKQKTQKKKKRRGKLELSIDPWILVTVLVVLILVIISFFIIHRYLQQ